MNKSPILFILFVACLISGCADQSAFNAPDQQRARSDKAQGDMSSSMKK